MGCHALLQGNFPTLGWNQRLLCLLYWQAGSSPLAPPGKPKFLMLIQNSVQFSRWTVNRSTPGLPVHQQLLEFTQTHVHRVSDAIQPSHPLSSPSPPAHNPSQHQGLIQWVSSSHEVAKVLEFQLEHQSFTNLKKQKTVFLGWGLRIYSFNNIHK